ncbi:hypothetical protein NQ117_16690 [Paenibacillus sp. SC116]|uniref:hypothetical protein n=1 Tax=Paenibacillus sp. SC116 TaxID=2968986 RepID=UPI00215A52C4|nr:hypothetical protein [Paenibacillus sp. SC116]MCR8845322.1 hypothetical protein [Paenibacillus sp. SC116]
MANQAPKPQETAPHRTEHKMTVKQYMIAVLVLDVLERDIASIGNSALKMAHVYVESLRRAQDEAHADLSRIRAQFRRTGIKVLDEERQSHGIRVQYVVQGYEHSFYLLRGLLRTEVTSLLKRYLHLPVSVESGH